MIIEQFAFNPFSENTYVVYDHTKDCIVIDPGCYESKEKAILKSFIQDHDLKVVSLINTHCHIDHVLGNNFVKSEFNVDLSIHRNDMETLKANEIIAPIYGFQSYERSEADSFIDEGEYIRFGDSVFEIIFVPGHAPGHIALINTDEKICIGGDVLFQQSIGRTDLPGGDYDTLISSIRDKLFKLPDDVTVYCGHGPNTTIGYEKQYNPFCGVMRN